MKNRMRELRTFGSVRGEGSDALAYSENRPEAAGGWVRVNYPEAAIASAAVESAMREFRFCLGRSEDHSGSVEDPFTVWKVPFSTPLLCP